MYHKNENGEWAQHPTRCHTSPEEQKKDLRHPYVFIAMLFYYFGENAVEIPSEYQNLIIKRQGCTCNHKDIDAVNGFLNWLQKQKPGKHGEPQLKPKHSK